MRIPSFVRPCAVLLFGLVAACGGSTRDDILAEDTTLTRDLALANADTSALPQLRDVPVVTQPAPAIESQPGVARTLPANTRQAEARMRRTPRRRTTVSPRDVESPAVTANGNSVGAGRGSGESLLGVIEAGETMEMFSGQRICTSTNSAGDRFTAMINHPVVGSNGATIPSGSIAIIEVIAARRSGNARDAVQLDLAVRSITVKGRMYQVASTVSSAQVERVRSETGSDDMRKVATGAAIGAIAGQIFGRKTKATVIGAATGAAAGAVVAATSAHYDGCVPSGGRIAIRLTEPLYLQM